MRVPPIRGLGLLLALAVVMAPTGGWAADKKKKKDAEVAPAAAPATAAPRAATDLSNAHRHLAGCARHHTPRT